MEILRLGAQNSTLKNPIVFSHDSSRQNTGVWIYHTIVSNDNIFIDISKGVNRHIVPNHRFGIDVR